MTALLRLSEGGWTTDPLTAIEIAATIEVHIEAMRRELELLEQALRELRGE